MYMLYVVKLCTRFQHIVIALKYISVRTKNYTIIVAQYNTDSDNVCRYNKTYIIIIGIYLIIVHCASVFNLFLSIHAIAI